MNIQKKFLIVMSTTLSAAILATSSFNIYQHIYNIRHAAQENAIATIEMAVMSLNKMFGLPQELEDLSGEFLLGQAIFFDEINQLVKSGSVSKNQFEGILSRISTKTALEFLIANPSGKVITSIPAKNYIGFQFDPDPRKQPQAHEFMLLLASQAGNIVQNIQVSSLSSQLMKYIATKTKDNHLNIIGYQGNRILKFMNIYSLESMAAQFKESKDIDAVWILNPGYKTSIFVQDDNKNLKHTETLPEYLLDLATESVNTREILTLTQGVHLYAACPFYDTMGNMAGTLLTAKNIAYINKDLFYQIALTIFIALLSIIHGIWGGHVFFRRLSREIEEISHETETITALELHASVAHKSDIQDIRSLQELVQTMKQKIEFLSAYVSKSLISRLFASAPILKISAENRPITLLHISLTNLSEWVHTSPPEHVVEQLSVMVDACTTIVDAQNGTTDKISGDTFIAMWGAPHMDAQQSYNACRTALLCNRTLQNLNQMWAEQGKLPLEWRISVHTGDAVVGNVGSIEHMHYTALGRAVTVASHLRLISASYAEHITISHAVYLAVRNDFTTRSLGVLAIPDHGEMGIYELISLPNDKLVG